MHLTATQIIILGILLAGGLHRTWLVWQRKGVWRQVIAWSAAAIVAYFGLLELVAGPAGGPLDRLPPVVLAAGLGALGLAVVLGLCELGFRAIDGPFPKLPAGVRPVNVDRRRLYPWMGGCAACIVLMAVALPIVPDSWHDNWSIATFMVGLISSVGLWFLHYKARRFDSGRTALLSNSW